MSAVVKTVTPFIDKECLLKALDKLNVKYTIRQNEIVTERKDYYGNQKFVFIGGKYKFQHDSSAEIEQYKQRWGTYPNGWQANWKEWKSVSEFLQAVEKKYNYFYKEKLAEIERKRQEALAEVERRRLEEEAKRLEEERKAYVEKQKQAIIEKAKAKGYAIKEKKVGNKIKLVLVRHTY
jgi:hypothetical protein